MDVVEQGKPALVAVPDDFTEFELGMLERFKEGLGLTNSTSRKEIIALEADLGFNLITERVAINNFSILPSALGVDKVVSIINESLRDKKVNIHKRPLSVADIVELGNKTATGLMNVSSSIYSNVNTAKLNQLLEDKYCKKVDGNVKEDNVVQVLLNNEYWDALLEDNIITKEDRDEVADFLITNTDLTNNVSSSIINLPLLNFVLNMGNVVIDKEADSRVEDNIQYFHNLNNVLTKCVNRTVVNITLETLLKKVFLKADVIIDNLHVLARTLRDELSKQYVTGICEYEIDIIDNVTSINNIVKDTDIGNPANTTAIKEIGILKVFSKILYRTVEK